MSNTLCPECGSSRGLREYEEALHCFKCNMHKPKKGSTNRRSLKPNTEPVDETLGGPLLPYFHDGEMPAEAMKWLLKHGIYPDLQKLYGIRYVRSSKVGNLTLKHRIVLPYYDEEGELIFYQARGFTEGEPKYLQVGPKKLFWSFGGLPELPVRTLVITEDILSAIRVGEFCQAAALCGCSLTDENLLTLLKNYSKIILWLDLDRAGIEADYELIKTMELYGKMVVQIHHKNEPKQLFRQELIDALGNLESKKEG